MEQMIFNHMATVREITEKSIKRIPEDMINTVPTGFNNNIHWNYGHIAYIQERLAYEVFGEPMNLSDDYEKFFSAGTKPADWIGTPPSIVEISTVLSEQKTRISATHKGRLTESLPKPFTNRMGITFSTIGETLLFSFYHEGMHMETIKQIYRSITLK